MVVQDNPSPVDDSRNRLVHWPITFILIAIAAGAVVGIGVVKFGQPVYIVVGLLGLAAFVASIFSVQFGLLVLVFLTYTRLSDAAVHNFNGPSVLRPFIILLILAIVVRWVIFRETPKGWQNAAVLLGMYGLVIFASLLFAADTARVTAGLLTYVKDAIIVLVVIILMQTGEAFRRVTWVLLLAGILLGTLSVYQVVTESYTNDFGGFAVANLMNIVGESYTYRIGGPVNDPNFFSQIMLVLVPIALNRFLNDPRFSRKAIAIWALVVCFICILFTYSRGGFVALVVTMLIFLWFNPLHARQVPIFIFSIIVLMAFAPENFYNRIFTLDQFFNTPGSVRTSDAALRDRATLNLVALEMIKTSPLIGVGYKNFGVEYASYAQILGIPGVSLETPGAHDLYLEIASETGLLGILAFFSLLSTAMYTIYRARVRLIESYMSDQAGMVTAFGVGFMGYLISAMFIHAAYPRYFYLLCGIALGLRLVVENTLNHQHSKKIAQL